MTSNGARSGPGGSVGTARCDHDTGADVGTPAVPADDRLPSQYRPTGGDAMDESQRLRPYVPGFVVDWLHDTPDTRHRAVEGTLAFVDVSGFTRLTERLAARGKVGAEEM